MNVLPVLLLFWGCLPGSEATCTTAYGDKIRYCKAFQTDYIEGIEILIFEIREVGRINSTLFSSPNLKSVLSLTLKDSNIHTIELGAFQQFQGLGNIELQDNSLTTLSPSWFHDPATLKNLTVSSNFIGQLRPEMLEGFSNLERLNLSRNQISSIHNESFQGLSKMASLDLSNNKITSLQWQTLSPLNGTIRLGGNPWNCSCAHKDFILFLKDLMNASRLADPSSVTCRYPPDMMDSLVWNVSEMNCSAPALPSSSPPEADLHKVVLPVVFVVLALILFILLIFLLWKKKQDRKQVRPDKRTKGEAIRGPARRSPPAFGGGVVMIANLMAFKNTPNQNPPTMGRAKSAAAILLQAEFNSPNGTQSQKRSKKSQSPDTLKGGHNPKETNEGDVEMWYYNKLQSRVFNVHSVPLYSSMMEDPSTRTPVVSMGPVEGDEHSTRSTTNTDEPFVYLCMGTTQEESTMTIPIKKTIISNKPQVIRRTLSWPNVHYKKESQNSYEDFLKTLNISPKLTGSHTGQDTKKTCQNLDHGGRPDTIQVPKDSKGLMRRMDFKKDQSLEDSSRNKVMEIQERKTTRNVYQRSSNSRRAPRSKIVMSDDGGVNRDSLHSQGSEARSELRRTPDDDQLLENNEYNFIDLLHEVVQNHGRWTRERWKQTHQQRIPSRTSPHS